MGWILAYLHDVAGADEAMGEPAFRGRQIFGWLHDKQVSSYQQMSNLPQTLRERLAVEMPLQPMQKSLVQHSAEGRHQKILDASCRWREY